MPHQSQKSVRNLIGVSAFNIFTKTLRETAITILKLSLQ